MWNKIWTIAWKDISTTYRDRNTVAVMLAAPLAVATIIALAFGGLGGGSSPIQNIPVAIVNLDEGSGETNFGAIVAQTFLPTAADAATSPTLDCPPVTNGDAATPSVQQGDLGTLVAAEALGDPAVARAGVDDGTYSAAIIIPEDFSARIFYSGPNDPIEATGIEVYGNGGRPIAAGIIRGIVEQIGSGILINNVATAASIDALIAGNPLALGQFIGNQEAVNKVFACAFQNTISNLRVDPQTVQSEVTNQSTLLLVIFGSAQAMFFCLFTGQGGVASIFEERRQWTLQRLVMSPTPRMAILLGKLGGTFLTCVIQLIFLFIALTIVGSILNGGLVFIWGTNFLLIGLVIIGAALASTGLGTLVAGIARTPEQGGIYGSLLNSGLALLGGAFGFQLPQSVAQFSPLWWGTDAFQKLSRGLTDVGLNIAVLGVFGIVLFFIGFYFFNRKIDI
jgi:ABC-type multidrug transport system permease subunit